MHSPSYMLTAPRRLQIAPAGITLVAEKHRAASLLEGGRGEGVRGGTQLSYCAVRRRKCQRIIAA
jgi:hypothetical protein